MSDVIVFVVAERHQHEVEDEEGNLFLDGECKVSFVEVSVSEAKKKYEEILEANADNPPYDSYDVKMAYWKEGRVLLPLDMFERRGDFK